MTMTGLEVFDSTIHKTNVWLDEIRGMLDLEGRHQAYQALRTVLHALRDRLTVEEVVELGAQLPMLVRGFYYEGWNPAGKPLKLNKQEFLSRIRESFRGLAPAAPEKIARVVFGVLTRHLSGGELKDVKGILPKALRELWPHAEGAQLS